MRGLIAWEQDVISAIRTAGITKNQALPGFTFALLSADRHPVTGAAVTAERSIDGAAFSACANMPAEVGSGVYWIDLEASDLNGDAIVLRFTATGAEAAYAIIRTNTVNRTGYPKNISDAHFPVLMLSADSPRTGLAFVAGERSIDGASFAAMTFSPFTSEIGYGLYDCPMSADDRNGTVITYRFTGTDADTTFVTIKTN